MGYDIYAYFDIAQEVVSNEITKLNFVCDDTGFTVNEEKEIVNWFIKYKNIKDIPINIRINYMLNIYSNGDKLHVFCTSHHSSFIRDDNRFKCKLYQRELSKKYNEPFPECLEVINWYIKTSEDAKEVADGLRKFFPEDLKLQSFAKWLDFTSKYCSYYELSY
jgi:hypothetical protein